MEKFDYTEKGYLAAKEYLESISCDYKGWTDGYSIVQYANYKWKLEHKDV